MAAQPDVLADPAELAADDAVLLENRPAAIVLALRRVDSHGHRLIDEASGGRLGAARGLVVGLGLGSLLWVCLGLAAWEFFRH